MREGWNIKKLGELIEIQNGYAFNSKQFSDDGDMPLIRIRDLKNGTTTQTRYTGEYDDKYLVHRGDFLIGMDGEFLCYEWKGEDALLNQRVCRLQDFDVNLEPKFLHYGINKYLKDIEDVTAYATVKHISARQIRDIQFPIPPHQEQKRIVAILDEAFAGIDTAIANTEKNLANARELFESYLSLILVQRSDGWVDKKLGDVCKLYQGLCINSKTKHLLVPTSNMPLLRIKDLRDNTEEQFIAETEVPSKALVNEDDILYTRTGSLGLVFRGRKGVLHNNSFKVVPNDLLDRGFLFWWLQEPLFKERIFKLASRAAQPDITHAIFKEQRIKIPPIEVQKTIESRIEEMDDETRRVQGIYKSKLRALFELKQSLLQKAFSGELTAEGDKLMDEAVA